MSTTDQLTLFPIGHKALELAFDGGLISSDGGLLLLREAERQLGLIKALAEVIPDRRDQRYVDHRYVDLLMQRIAQIAAGYEDGNDCNSLRHDPVFKMMTDRSPEAGAVLASQPTMCRFENAMSRTVLYRLARVFVQFFLNSYADEPPVIVLDFDDTASITYGDQQMTLFNGFYNEHCYMPLHVYEGLSGKLITTILKPGQRMKGAQLLPIVKRLVTAIRQRWSKTLIIIRGDSHFTAPELMNWVNTQPDVGFVTGLGANPRLTKQVEDHLKRAKNVYEKTKEKVSLFHGFYYQADSWAKMERVVAKVEVSNQGVNIRFVVTSFSQAKATDLYQIAYCGRGQDENYIKDHKLYLKSDRTSCHRFEANQFRLWLHSAAYVLTHSLKTQALKNTPLTNATIHTIQLKLFKIGVRVKEMKTKIKLEFPTAYPLKETVTKCVRIFETMRLNPG